MIGTKTRMHINSLCEGPRLMPCLYQNCENNAKEYHSFCNKHLDSFHNKLSTPKTEPLYLIDHQNVNPYIVSNAKNNNTNPSR